jgi:hypothetical protein
LSGDPVTSTTRVREIEQALNESWSADGATTPDRSRIPVVARVVWEHAGADLSSQSRPFADSWPPDAERLYRSGKLLREIGQRFGVSQDCVRLACKRRGVVLLQGPGARQ